jgi:tetratricopeptide (TPR) repeat protein
MQKYAGQFDEAEKNSKKCMELSLTINDHEGYIQSIGNLGDIFLQKEETEKAKEFYKKAVNFSQENNCEELYILPAIYLGLAQAELMLGNEDTAKKLKVKTLNLAEKTQRDDIIQAIKQIFEN